MAQKSINFLSVWAPAKPYHATETCKKLIVSVQCTWSEWGICNVSSGTSYTVLLISHVFTIVVSITQPAVWDTPSTRTLELIRTTSCVIVCTKYMSTCICLPVRITEELSTAAAYWGNRQLFLPLFHLQAAYDNRQQHLSLGLLIWTLLKMKRLKSVRRVAKNGNNVEAMFNFLLLTCCFVMLLMWMGHYAITFMPITLI